MASRSSSNISGTRPGRISVRRSPNARGEVIGKAGGAHLRDRHAAGGKHQAAGDERAVVRLHPEPPTMADVGDPMGDPQIDAGGMRIPPAAWRRSARADPSQNNWPRVFSWKAMPCFCTRAMKSAGVYRLSADRQKCGLSDRNRSGTVPVLVKLHRPPPEIRILAPGMRRVIQHQHAPAALPGADRAHQPRRAGAQHNHVESGRDSHDPPVAEVSPTASRRVRKAGAAIVPRQLSAASNLLYPRRLAHRRRPGLMADPLIIARAGSTDLALLPALANRHGCITGATGTGKTVTLQVMAENFSRIGVPVFMADVKGDLTGIAKAGHAVGPDEGAPRSAEAARAGVAGVPGHALGRLGRAGSPDPGHRLRHGAAADGAAAQPERDAGGRARAGLQGRRRQRAAAARPEGPARAAAVRRRQRRPASAPSTATSRRPRSGRSSAGCCRSRRRAATSSSASRCSTSTT